jgi:hypothetical protein
MMWVEVSRAAQVLGGGFGSSLELFVAGGSPMLEDFQFMIACDSDIKAGSVFGTIIAAPLIAFLEITPYSELLAE